MFTSPRDAHAPLTYMRYGLELDTHLFAFYFYLLRHSSERCCFSCHCCIGIGWSGLNLRFLYRLFGRSSKTAFIQQDRQPHGNGIGGLKFQPFLSFLFHYVVSQGAPNSKVVRSRESVRIPTVLPTPALCAGWLVGRGRQYLIRRGSILVCKWLRCCQLTSDWVTVDRALREACGRT